MHIKDIAAYRLTLQQEMNHTGVGWEADYMGSPILVEGQRRFGFFNFFQGGTEEGRDAVANKLRGVLEMAQNDQAIYEITQNAADCGSTEMKLWYDVAHFLAFNDGNAFDERDVRSILDTFSSQKAYRDRPENAGMIGQYGVGFKLFHRLVGRESGLEELLEQGAGPMVFSWNTPEQLANFLDPAPLTFSIVPYGATPPWLFKILLTCFPAAPGEVVRGMDYTPRVAFTMEELELFRTWARERLTVLDREPPPSGSMFFLALGEGKQTVLDRHMDAIRSCMGVSLHFLRSLVAITVNGERIDRVPLDRIELKISKEDLRDIGFKEDHQDVELVFAFSDLAIERLVHEPTLYQYFPMTKETHSMAYVIHSNGLQKQAQRTELNADSAINVELFKRLAHHVQETALNWMTADPDRYRALFKAILSSAFAPSKLNVFHEHVQQPLIDFIRQHVPTMDGLFVPAERVLVRRSQLSIPLDRFGIERHWFNWHAELDSALIERAKEQACLGLKEATVEQVLRKVGTDALDQWIATLSGDAYTLCLQELQENKVDLRENGGLRVFRLPEGAIGLNALLAEPARLNELEACYAAYPALGQWQSRAVVEATLAVMAEPLWNAATSEVLFQLKESKAMQALVERLPEIVVDDHTTAELLRFMEWWQKYRDQPVANLLRPKLKLRTATGELEWDVSLVSERFKVRLPAGNEKEFSLHVLFPGSSGSPAVGFDHLQKELLAQGFDADFLNLAFRRRHERGKQDLHELGDRLVEQYKESGLDNGCQLAFAVALKHLHKEWKGFDVLELRDSDDALYPMEGWWYLDTPLFISSRFVLAEQYSGITDYFVENWGAIKHGKLLLAPRPHLGESFEIGTVRDDLDGAQRIAFMNWFATEAERNKGSIDLIRNKEHLPLLTKMLGSDPAGWIEADEQLTLEPERPPKWVYQWADGNAQRTELLKQLGSGSTNEVIVQWRTTLLAGEATPPLEDKVHHTNTLLWIRAMGGAERFRGEEHERSILALMRAAGLEPRAEMRSELELHAVESTEPSYLTWKADGADWILLEYPEETLPLNWAWQDHDMARYTGQTAFAPVDGSKRIFIAKGYPPMVALYQFSVGKDAPVPIAVRDGYKKVFDKQRAAGPAVNHAIERPTEELSLKQKVEHFLAQQLAYGKQLKITLAELVNAVEWEYGQKLLDRENGNTYRFKEVEQLPDGVLVLRRPNVAELPYELVSDKDRSITGLKLKLRKRGVAYHEIKEFELLGSTEGEVRVRVPELPFALNESAVALIELPVEDMLLKVLAAAWRHIARTNVTSRSLADLVKERAPGGQVGFIFGPPGTGKTTVLADRLIATVRDTEAKVLVLTPTNTAADVLYARISEKASEDYKVLQGVHRFGSLNKDIRLDDGYPAVVITTMHRFTFDHFANGVRLSDVDWDHVVFDEASMVALPYALLPLMSLPNNRGTSTWGALGARFLFAGDPFQLMPVGATPSMGDKLDAFKKDQRIRGYATENIFTLAGINSFQLEEAPELPGARIDRLATNYRSGKSLVQLFSAAFYEHGVDSARGTDAHDITLGSESLPAIGLWSFPVSLQEKGPASEDLLSPSTIIHFDNSAVHVHSALLAARLAVVLATENAGKRVIIICPYGRQVRVCQALLESFNEQCPEEPGPDEQRAISVSSVHRYQGGEAEIVIFLLNPTATKAKEDGRLVIGDIALFNDPNLINVAISRARDVLIVLAPEDNISRTGYSSYLLMDRVLQNGQEGVTQYTAAHSAELEQLLFNGQVLEERVSIMPIRALDLYRVQNTRERGTDLVVLHNKENLNMVMAQDIVMEGVKAPAV